MDLVCQTKIVFQPVVELKTARVVGYEALLRGPAGGRYQAPDAFLDRAAREGVLLKVERLLAERASEIAMKVFAGKKLFFNLTPTSFLEADLLSSAFSGLNPRQVVIELTEAVPGLNAEMYKRAGAQWRAKGRFILALDDVGAGYARFPAIAHLRPGYLKIDRNLFHSAQRKRLLPYLIRKAKQLGAQVVVEGLESLQDIEEARSLGAELGQGFYWGLPEEMAAPKTKIA